MTDYAAVVTNIERGIIHIGEDKTFTMTVQDENGDAVDISDWTEVTFTVWEDATKKTALMSLSVSGGEVTITTPTSGIYQIVFTDTMTDYRDAGTYYWSSGRADAGNEIVVGEGRFVLSP